MTFDDPELVRDQYATEANLRARQSIYGDSDGPDPREVALAAVAETAPSRVLEVGGGPGELAERIVRELGVELKFVDQSPRMVEMARSRGLDAEVGDVQDLPFGDGEFDCAVAAWMLYHVPDLDRGLSELARVLRPGGRLVAVTNGAGHLEQLRALFPPHTYEVSFTRENAEEHLRRHFADVERRDAMGWVTIRDREAVLAYLHSMTGYADAELDRDFEPPLRTQRVSTVLVATR